MKDLSAIAFILLLGIAHICAGYAGIDYHFGSVWAFIAIFLALVLRFTLPVTIGAFFGAMDVWDWHWAFAAFFTAPGLVLIIPGVLADLIFSKK
ncbi:MAG: hypothetical protein INF44_04870 [Thalassospira sp.]|nr:hypothetical protein [Thalassospira sp.]